MSGGNGQSVDPLFDMVPPNCAEAETCLLGGIFRQPEVFGSIAGKIRSTDFYQQRNKLVFSAMRSLQDDGKPIDGMFVSELIAKWGKADEIERGYYLDELFNASFHGEFIDYYTEKIVEKSKLRRVYYHCLQLARAAFSDGASWSDLTDGIEELRDLIDDRELFDATPCSIGELIDSHPHLRPSVIDGLLRRGETANIIADPKRGNSWLAYGLALSIYTGRDWLDTFSTTAGRVLLIDNELHPSTIASRIPTVADALKIRADDYRDLIDVISLRGRLTDYYGIDRFLRRTADRKYAVVIVDAHYRMIPTGVSENENAAMAQLYSLIDRFAGETNAAWILIHHASKGSQGDKSITDVGAGAGAQSRAADTHLIIREHEEPGYVVLEGAVRSFPPVEPLVLEWKFPIWMLCDNLDTGAIRGRLNKNEQRQLDRDAEGIRRIVDAMLDGSATIREIRRRTGGMGKARAERLLDRMEADGQVSRKSVSIRGNETHEYQISEDK